MFTFADLLLASGALAAATSITLLISLIKTAIPDPVLVRLGWLADGALLAFVGSAALYVVAAVDLHLLSLEGGLQVFLSWLGCAAASVSVHKMLVKPVVEKVKGE